MSDNGGSINNTKSELKKGYPQFDLSLALTKMIHEHEYYANLVLNMKRHITTRVPTAGVNITSQINLYINPYFWSNLNISDQIKILLHECHHVISNHMARSRVANLNHKVYNIAADCAINQHILDFDKMEFKGVTLEAMKEQLQNPNLESNREAEYYYNEIRNDLREKIKNGEIEFGDGDGCIDSHDLWDEGDTELNDVVLKNALQKAKEQTKPGKVPGEVETAIQNLTKPQVNWKNALKRFFGNVVEYNKKTTRNRRNRRYGIQYPGKRKLRKSHVACIIDSSGSVSDEALMQFMGEIDVIYKQGFDITFIVADCDVQTCIPYKPGCIDALKGRGGTAYQPAIDEALKQKVEGIIYFGDGDCADTPTKPNVPFLWAMIEGCKPPVDWGRVIEVPVPKE